MNPNILRKSKRLRDLRASCQINHYKMIFLLRSFSKTLLSNLLMANSCLLCLRTKINKRLCFLRIQLAKLSSGLLFHISMITRNQFVSEARQANILTVIQIKRMWMLTVKRWRPSQNSQYLSFPIVLLLRQIKAVLLSSQPIIHGSDSTTESLFVTKVCSKLRIKRFNFLHMTIIHKLYIPPSWFNRSPWNMTRALLHCPKMK